MLVEELTPVQPGRSKERGASGRTGRAGRQGGTHSVVFTDFDLSMIVSVPTSRRPTSVGAMLYFSSRFCARELGLHTRSEQ